MNVQQVLQAGTKKLKTARIENAAKDARLLLSHAFGCEASRLFLMHEDDVPEDVLAKFERSLSAREQFQPISQIIGGREFWGRWFEVTSDVLDPRPETETLVELAIKSVHANSILDLGTGTGVLAISLAAELPKSHVVATDISSAALAVAMRNAEIHKISKRIEFSQSDWFENIGGKFDLIVSNPPYISAKEMEELALDVKNWEPELALTPGGDGLSAYREIASKLRSFLNNDGLGLFEIGYAQGQDVCEIFIANGFGNVRVEQDMNGHDRIIVVQG